MKHKSKITRAEITREYGFLKVDGKHFKLNPNPKSGRVSYVEITENEFEEKKKLMKEITDRLKESLDKEAVLMEALSKLETEYLEHLHNALYNSKRIIKPKTRKHHCVDMTIGKMIVPIVDG